MAVPVPPGPVWRAVLAEAWEAEAAVLPIDFRLPPAEATRLIETARPTVILDEPGEGDLRGLSDALRRLPGGIAADPSVAAVVATSGTAGAPKLVEIGRDAVRAAVHASAEALACGSAEPWLVAIPLAHMGGLLVVMRSVLLGAAVEIHPRFDVAAFEDERDAMFTSVVPTMLSRLLDAGADLARFRSILVGGAALPDSLRIRAEAKGARVVATYGLTETCGGCVYEGRPLRGVEVKVGERTLTGVGGALGGGDARASSRGAHVGVPTGGPQEILVRGAVLMRGYRLESGPADALGDGWLRTGDAGAIQDDRLQVSDRLDDLIVTGGEKVSPSEVEDVLREHPGISDVAVVGRDDPEWGKRVVAYVVPADTALPPGLEEVREFVRRRLAAYKAPRALEIVSELPRTGSGKVSRLRLP